MSITLILVIMTCVISYQALQQPAMTSRLAFSPYAIKHNGEYFRFLTSAFVHGSWPHLFFNVFVMYQFGIMAESAFSELFGGDLGKVIFLLFYLSANVMSHFSSYFRHRDHMAYSAVGASGATSALVFLYIVLAPWAWFQFPPLPAIVFGILYLAYSSYMDKRGIDNIGHNTHLWGSVYGIIFILLAVYFSRPELLDILWSNLLAGPTSLF